MTPQFPAIFMQAAPSPFLSTLPMILIIGVIFYFFVWRPQRTEEKEHQTLLSGLQRGDKVVTTSGIHGKVHEVRTDAIVLEVCPNGFLTVDREAVKKKQVEKVADAAKKS